MQSPRILKMTLGYVPEEDRICMSSLTEDGSGLKLWATLRLLNLLVLHLSDRYPKPAAPDTQATAQEKSTPGEVQRDAAVTLPAGCMEFLVTSVDISYRQKALGLVFRGQKLEHNAEFLLDEELVHSWLRALQECYRLGDWHTSAWTQDSSAASQLRDSQNEITIH